MQSLTFVVLGPRPLAIIGKLPEVLTVVSREDVLLNPAMDLDELNIQILIISERLVVLNIDLILK